MKIILSSLVKGFTCFTNTIVLWTQKFINKLAVKLLNRLTFLTLKFTKKEL